MLGVLQTSLTMVQSIMNIAMHCSTSAFSIYVCMQMHISMLCRADTNGKANILAKPGCCQLNNHSTNATACSSTLTWDSESWAGAQLQCWTCCCSGSIATSAWWQSPSAPHAAGTQDSCALWCFHNSCSGMLSHSTCMDTTAVMCKAMQP